MLDRELLEKKMDERGFIVYATINTAAGKKLQFISKHMYDMTYNENTPPRQRKPVINIIVNLENGEFECAYAVPFSINKLVSPSCSPVMDDDHFDNIVGKFELAAKMLERLR